MRPATRLLFALGLLAATACGRPSPRSERLTPEKAAELIRTDAKFNQSIAVAGKTIGARSLIEVTNVTQGTGPGLDPGSAEAEFTFRWVPATPELDPALRDALPADLRGELFASTPSKGQAALRRFEDGWHVVRYRNMYLGS